MIGFIFNAALSALNFALYAISGSPWSMFAGIFCGAIAAFCLVLDVTS